MEYKHDVVSARRLDDFLNTRAAEGWELFSLHRIGDTNQQYTMFDVVFVKGGGEVNIEPHIDKEGVFRLSDVVYGSDGPVVDGLHGGWPQ